MMHREKHLDQALRDFEYVIDITNRTHALAYRQASIVAQRIGDTVKAITYAAEERRVLESSTEFHKWYKIFDLPLPIEDGKVCQDEQEVKDDDPHGLKRLSRAF